MILRRIKNFLTKEFALIFLNRKNPKNMRTSWSNCDILSFLFNSRKINMGITRY